jgi:glycosyltransferase involved in cell wall biosynthesis
LVLCGWFEPSFWLLWLWGVALGKPILFSIESTAYDGPRRRWREICKRLLLRRATGCVVPGRRSFEYCARLGMKEERIFVAPNSVDQAHFRERAADLRTQREVLRRELGIQGIALLFVGRLVEEHKGVSTLIKAFKKIENQTKPLHLLIVGAGPDLPYYENLAKQMGGEGVCFLGERNQNQLCQIYAAADIFILPSLCEQWGLVLNEAMEFGLPLVVSEAVGAGPDLVRPGNNGFVFPVGDEEVLARILTDLVREEELRNRLGQASRMMIRDFSPENWARGMSRAIASLGRPPGSIAGELPMVPRMEAKP